MPRKGKRTRKPERLKADADFWAKASVGYAMGLLALQYMAAGGKSKKKSGLPPVHPKRAGPWRGKGSFGKGFGPQARHK